jgi:orotidine-5'-phosphate decarboxylase
MTQSATFIDKLNARHREAHTMLCIGLDPVSSKLPPHIQVDAAGVVRFCQEIVEATATFAAAFKPNLAFFTELGRDGLDALWAVKQAIPADIPVILDCKVGDVGETARAYARGWFDAFGFDAITVNPYLGEDALEPFFQYGGRGVIVICKTSNPGSGDFQDRAMASGGSLFLEVADSCRAWDDAYPAQVGLVVGATYPEELAAVRQRVGNQLILVPGLGAQGGDVAASIRAGLDVSGGGLLLSASRSILYAGDGRDFATAAEHAARNHRDEIAAALGDVAG